MTRAGTSALTATLPPRHPLQIWFGDNPGHDPSNAGVTLPASIAALTSRGIRVIALEMGKLNQWGQVRQAGGVLGVFCLASSPAPDEALVHWPLEPLDCWVTLQSSCLRRVCTAPYA